MRWTPQCEEYKAVMSLKMSSKRQKLKMELQALVKERIFYINTIAHHAGWCNQCYCSIVFIVGGQKQAVRVSKMISRTTAKVSKLFEEYRSLLEPDDHELTITVSDICNLESAFWVVSDHSRYTSRRPDDVPASVQRRIIELFNLQCRAQEEQQLVISDGINCITSLEKNLVATNSAITTLLSLSDTTLDANDENMFESLSCICTSHLCLREKGILSALITKAEHTYLRLCRIRDTTQYLCAAFFNKAESEINLKLAKTHSHAPILAAVSPFYRSDFMGMGDDSLRVPSSEESSELSGDEL